MLDKIWVSSGSEKIYESVKIIHLEYLCVDEIKEKFNCSHACQIIVDD